MVERYFINRRGFTLIELLIVVAIIGILAAIAIPNFLQAQTRAKVSRALSDMRSLQLAVETYVVDHGQEPLDYGQITGDEYQTWIQLTSPISYISSVPLQPFNEFPQGGRAGLSALSGWWLWTPNGIIYDYGIDRDESTGNPFFGFPETGTRYLMLSLGPDNAYDFPYTSGNFSDFQDTLRTKSSIYIYDPSNGTISNGDIYASNHGLWGGGIK